MSSSNPTVGAYRDGRWSGISGGGIPAAERAFADAVRRHGHATVEPRDNEPTNHRIIGCGVGHSDATFAETGESMAAYYESGQAFDGRWWDDASDVSVRYYGATREQYPASVAFGRHLYLAEHVLDHAACPYDLCERR